MRFSTVVCAAIPAFLATTCNAVPVLSLTGIVLPRFEVSSALAAFTTLKRSEALPSLKNLETRATNSSSCPAQTKCTDAYNNKYTCGDNSETYCYNTSGDQCSCTDPKFDAERTQNARKEARKRKQAELDKGKNLCTDTYGNRYECGDNSESHCYNTTGDQCSCTDPNVDIERTQNAKKDAQRRKKATTTTTGAPGPTATPGSDVKTSKQKVAHQGDGEK